MKWTVIAFLLAMLIGVVFSIAMSMRQPAPPSGRSAPADSDLARRQAVFSELHWAGMRATRAAEEKYPFKQMPTEQDELQAYLANRKIVYEDTKRENWLAVGKKHGLGLTELQAIDDEGSANRWPLGEEK